MAITLTTVRDQLEIRLSDSSNLIWSTNLLDESIRAALADISKVFHTVQTLSGLDGALLTSLDELDLNCLLVGSLAYAFRFRLINRFEQASPEEENPQDLALLSTDFMNDFQSMLTQIRLRLFYHSTDSPHSAWEWEEGSNFS